MRAAGAPISWGVCEAPGWGLSLPAGRVLGEMAALGLTATELGPAGYLPADPAERTELLARYGLAVAGGFVPVVLHDPDRRPELPDLDGWSGTLVLAAATGRDGYDTRPQLGVTGWRTLISNLDRLHAAAAGAGVTVALHPHVGTMVERAGEVRRVLEESTIPLCLDTGHLMVGGVDPAELARAAAARIAHVHLKDVAAGLAGRVGAGELSYSAAVREGLYRPLGHGDVDIAGIVGTLTLAGYAGWYVLEQDTMLAAEPPPGEGPVTDVRASLAYLRAVAP